MSDLITELSAFMADYGRAANSHDVAQVLPLIADDATYWFTDGPYRGREEIAGALERTFAAIQDEVYEIRALAARLRPRPVEAEHDVDLYVARLGLGGLIREVKQTGPDGTAPRVEDPGPLGRDPLHVVNQAGRLRQVRPEGQGVHLVKRQAELRGDPAGPAGGCRLARSGHANNKHPPHPLSMPASKDGHRSPLAAVGRRRLASRPPRRSGHIRSGPGGHRSNRDSPVGHAATSGPPAWVGRLGQSEFRASMSASRRRPG
jgi:SnoaL-like domain